VTCTLASLGNGDSHTFTVTGKVASSLDHCLDNSASVSSGTGDLSTANNDASVCAPIEGKADLSITKSPSSASVPAGGGQVIYTLVVRNHGPSDATGVEVSDPMASGLTLVAAEASQGSCTTADGKLSCDLGNLREGGSAQVLVTAQTFATPRPITNTAKVQGGQTDPTPSNNADPATVTVGSGPPPPTTSFDLAVTKRASDRTASLGQPIRYTITVENTGPGAAPDVKLTDTPNSPTRLVSVKTSSGSCGKRLPLRCSVGTIPTGGKVTVTVVAKPKEAGRRQRNAASATGAGTDTTPQNNLGRVDVKAEKVQLKLSKVAERSTVAAGGLISYTIRVSNRTGGTARKVSTCDDLPAGLVYVRSNSKAKLSAGRYCWKANAIGPHQTRRYRITVRALPGASGQKLNSASTSGADAKPARANRTVRVLPAAGRGGGVTG
jgi:uncharacterized repeat protein (TIGR01451 family)